MKEILLCLIFLLFIKTCTSTNYILPIHTINIYYNESIIMEDYLSKIFSEHLYTNFIIGSEKEELKALINMSQIGFFIYENAYNYNFSSSFQKSIGSKNFYKKDQEEGYIANDTLCLLPYTEKIDVNNINIKNCKDFEKVNFSLLKNKQKNIENNLYENYGIIGLQENTNQDEYIMPLFIKSLKNTDVINSHTFSFHYLNNTKSGENEGYILLGDEEFDEDNGRVKSILSQPKYGQVYWNLIFTKVIGGINDYFNTSSDNHLRNFDIKDAQLIGDLPYIVGVNEYKLYIRSVFFEELLMKDVCSLKNILLDEDYYTYVCDSKSDLFIEKFKNFPKLFFEHYDLDKTFILDQYDLFTYNNINKSDSNIYFLIFFSNKKEPYKPEFPGGNTIIRWKLGIPFFKKYKLYFNADNRMITYYEKFNKNDNGNYNDNNDEEINKNGNNNNNKNSNRKNKNSTWIKVLIIGGLLIIFFILGILFHKNIIRLPRKKKANELEDDYEYTINPNTLDEKKASLNNYEVSN